MRTFPQIESAIVSIASTMVFSAGVKAQSVQEGPLPEPLISSECVTTNDPYAGWDGEQSCFPSDIWFYGADYPLSQTNSDLNGDNLAWDRPDFLNKTIRCDIFDRSLEAQSGCELK